MTVVTTAFVVTKSTLGKALAVHFQALTPFTSAGQFSDTASFLANHGKRRILHHLGLLLNRFLAETSGPSSSR